MQITEFYPFPGGKMIKELQQEHNVRINIDKQKNDDGTKNVEICGKHSNDIHNATDAINGIVSRSMDRGRNNDRNQGHGRDNQRRENHSSSRGSYNNRSEQTEIPSENWDDEDITKTGYKPSRPTQVYNSDRNSTTNRYLDQYNSSDNWDNVTDNQQNYNGKPLQRYEAPKDDDWGSGNYGSSRGGNKRDKDGGFNRRNNDGGGSGYNKSSYNFNSQYSSFMDPQEESTSNEPVEIDWDKINEQCVSKF